MGNSKSKKVKITQGDSPAENEDSQERIKKIKEISELTRDGGKNPEQARKPEQDNASNASTVEALDDK